MGGESWVLWILVSLLLGSVVARSALYIAVGSPSFFEWEPELQTSV